MGGCYISAGNSAEQAKIAAAVDCGDGLGEWESRWGAECDTDGAKPELQALERGQLVGLMIKRKHRVEQIEIIQRFKC